MRQIQPAVVFGVSISSFFSFLFLRDVQVTCTEEFHDHIMASRSNMAAWSGCGIHRDIIYKTEDKNQSNNFVYPPVTKHTYSGTKGQFFNHTNEQLCSCDRPLPLSSVLYDEIGDYRGGWGVGGRKNKEERRKRAVDDVVMWMRSQSCPPRRERLAELASFVRQFPLPSRVTRTAYTR